MSLVCLDTHILIWAIREDAKVGQEEFITKSKVLLSHLDDQNKKVLIPTIVLTEMILHLSSKQQMEVVNLMTENYFIAPFDQKAALHYARMWNSRDHQKTVGELKASGLTKREIDADRMIIATAVAHQAECIYSHDKDLRKFATGFCDAFDIPTIPTQPPLIDG